MTLQHSTISVEIIDSWTIRVNAGIVQTQKGRITIVEPVSIGVPPLQLRQVRDERHETLPIYDENQGVWCRGIRLNELITEVCVAPGLLVPQSLRIKKSSGESEIFCSDRDYKADPVWATCGRIPGSRIREDQPVFLDYDYCPCRLDSIAVSCDGGVKLVLGNPGIGEIHPPVLEEDEIAVANIWQGGRIEKLTDENIYVIEPEIPVCRPSRFVAESLLPKTMAKLRQRQSLTIVAWGDSVTNYCNYQAKFAEGLRLRFPHTPITLYTAAWPGATSLEYMRSPAGSKYDFVRDVLDRNPDMVTIEFVNDAAMDESQTLSNYEKVLDPLRKIGAEIILIVPHLVRPDWMDMKTMKFDEDPRPYVKALKKFALSHNIALADASKYWTRLWRQGIPYITLQINSINHPDERGHKIFAKALLELFPEN